MGQIYSNYTEQDHKVWASLFNRIMQLIPENADEAVIEGIKKLELPKEHIPDLLKLNKRLNSITGWTLVPLEQMVPDREFIEMLSKKQYPCRIWIRNLENLDNIYIYDIFHDVIGHFPLLTNPNYRDFLSGLGKIAMNYIDNDHAIELLTRVYWQTVQFGLIARENSIKIYGAHILASAGEAIYALSAGVPKYDYNIAKIMEKPYIKKNFQQRYFVINSYEELYNSLEEIERQVKINATQAQS